MDKNQATGLILLFGILFAYFTFFAPKPEQLPAAKKEAAKLAADAGKKASQEEIAYSGLRQAGLADSSITIDTIPLILENEDIRVSISPLGGQVREVQLKKYKTWDGKPLILLSGKRSASISLLMLLEKGSTFPFYLLAERFKRLEIPLYLN